MDGMTINHIVSIDHGSYITMFDFWCEEQGTESAVDVSPDVPGWPEKALILEKAQFWGGVGNQDFNQETKSS